MTAYSLLNSFDICYTHNTVYTLDYITIIIVSMHIQPEIEKVVIY